MHRFAAIGAGDAGTAADSASPLAGGLDPPEALDALDAFEPALEAPAIAGATAAGSAALDAVALDAAVLAGALDGALAAASDASVSRGTAARRDPPEGGAMPCAQRK